MYLNSSVVEKCGLSPLLGFLDSLFFGFKFMADSYNCLKCRD
jgi:hypothetical protein